MVMLDEEGARTIAASAPPSSADSPLPSAWLPYRNTPYLIGERIAAGGMGTVNLGLKHGALGFRRLVAIKRLHAHLAAEPDFVARFKDEIRLVSRLNHPNVIQTFDVLESTDELALVMEYVEGVTLHQLMRDASTARAQLPIPVAVGVVAQALHGLHAAHELVDDDGLALQLVHRDFSPQNILIAREGIAKVLDFGVAKASSELHITKTGHLSGKVPYMAPEQVLGNNVDRRTDVFAAGVVLWEALTGSRLFRPPGAAENVALVNVLELRVQPPSSLRSEVDPALDRLVLRALDRDPARRYGSARDFALALEEVVKEATPSAVANGVMSLSAHRLASRAPALTAVPSFRSESGMWRGEGGTRIEGARAHNAAANALAYADTTTLEQSATRAALGESHAAEASSIDVHEVPRALQGASRAPRWPWALALTMLSLLGGATWQHLGSQAASDNSEAVAGEQSRGAGALPRALPTAQNPGGGTKDLGARSVQTIATEKVVPEPPSAPAAATAAQRGKSGAAAPTRSKRPSSASNKPGCSPPTYVDSEGIRHFKPECL